MSVQLEEMTLPAKGDLQIDIRLSATVNVTAFTARQKVTGYVADELSTSTHGGQPSLHVGERLAWRVPVILSLPPRGDLGEVGHIDVDLDTGELLITQAALLEMNHRAKTLAISAAPQTTATS